MKLNKTKFTFRFLNETGINSYNIELLLRYKSKYFRINRILTFAR